MVQAHLLRIGHCRFGLRLRALGRIAVVVPRVVGDHCDQHKAPRIAKLSCKVLIKLLISSHPGQVQGGLHIDRNNTRNTLLLHGDTHELACHFHGNFVVADE